MEIGAVLTAVGFGFVVGLGLAAFLPDDRLAAVASLVVAFVFGAVVYVASLGSEPTLVGGSLLLGATAGLTGLFLRDRMTTSGDGSIP